MQRCKSAYGLCKGAKVNDKTGRGVASPRPCFHRRSRRSLAPTRERGSLDAARSARSADPTSRQCQAYPRLGATLPAHEPEEGEGDDDGDHEAAAAGANLVDASVYFLHELVVVLAHGYVLIGTELPCKGGMEMKVEDRVRSTDYVIRNGSDPIAEGLYGYTCTG